MASNAKLPTQRLEYKSLQREALPSKIGGTRVRVTSAQQLALLLGGQWWASCDCGSARCPACHMQGLTILRCDGIGIRVLCREGCTTPRIHKALRDVGVTVAELWLP